MSNNILRKTIIVMTYPCNELGQSLLVEQSLRHGLFISDSRAGVVGGWGVGCVCVCVCVCVGGGGGGGWHLSHHCLENTSDHPAPTDRTQKTVKSIREMILLLEYHLGNISRNFAVFPCGSHSNSLPSRTKIRAEILTFMMPVDMTIWQQNVHSMKHILMLPRVVCYPNKTMIQD